MGEQVKRIGTGFSHAGLWCVEVWLYYVVSFMDIPLGFSWQLPYAVCMVAALSTTCFGFVFERHVAAYGRWRGLLDAVDRASAILACAGTLALGAVGVFAGVSPALGLAGLLVAGYHAGTQFVRWGVLYSRSSTQEIARLVVTQSLIGSAVTIALMLLPQGLSLAIACLLPALSSVFLEVSGRTWRDSDSEPSIFSARQLAGMWRVWVVLLGTTLIMGVIGNASISCFSMPPQALLIFQKVAMMCFCLFLLGLMLKSGAFIGFTHLWRIVMISIGVLLLVVSGDPSSFVFELLTTTLHSIMHVFLLVTVCDMVGRTKLAVFNSYAILGLLLGAYFGVLVAAAPVSTLLGIESVGQAVPHLFFLLVVTAASSWGANDFAMRAMFEDAGRDPSMGEARRAVNVTTLCEQAAEHYGLTRREAEILGMLLMNRTRTYIAETLFISENTVKTHVSSIYSKTGVHSKKDLRALLGF